MGAVPLLEQVLQDRPGAGLLRRAHEATSGALGNPAPADGSRSLPLRRNLTADSCPVQHLGPVLVHLGPYLARRGPRSAPPCPLGCPPRFPHSPSQPLRTSQRHSP